MRARPGSTPSGRDADSILITRTPNSRRICEHSGPAHNDDRSATTGRSRSRSVRDARTVTATPSPPVSGTSPSTATGRPSQRGRIRDSRAPTGRAPLLRPSANGRRRCTPRRAKPGSSQCRRGSASVTAIQLSAVGKRRVPPPQLMRPWRRYPYTAARSASRRAGSRRSGASRPAACRAQACGHRVEPLDEAHGRTEWFRAGSTAECHRPAAGPRGDYLAIVGRHLDQLRMASYSRRYGGRDTGRRVRAAPPCSGGTRCPRRP